MEVIALHSIVHSSNLKVDNSHNAILLPKLSYVIDVLLTCYNKLDNYFKGDSIKFKNLCKEYIA